jgi:tRNA nucleotidyltransferase/poly(A) polymerase
MCVPILKNLSFSNKQIEYISYIIKKHMYPSAVVSSPELNEKVKMRYVRKSGDMALDNILIAQADRLSALGVEISQKMVDDNISALNDLRDFYLAKKETLQPLEKLLDGNEIMQILNIKPSKRLGEIVDMLTEAQINGDISTKDEAITFIKTL